MSGMPTVKDFVDNGKVKELVKITNRINIFNILGKDESETSDTLFMAWLFNLDKEKDNCFAKMFLREIRFDDQKFDYFEVFPEKTISSLAEKFNVLDNFSKNRTKPDIVIIFYRNGVPCGLLLIENKINADESENQTAGYAQFMNSLSSVPNKKGIFLTREGKKASSESFESFERKKVLKKTVESYLQTQIISRGTNPAIIDLISQYYEKLDIEDRLDEIEKEIIMEFKSLILTINDDKEMKKEIPDNYLLTYNDLFDQCRKGTKTILKDYNEYIFKNNFSKNDKIVKLGKEINDILVDKDRLVPRYTPSGISFLLNKKLFIWMTLNLKKDYIQMGVGNWSEYKEQLEKNIPNIKKIQTYTPEKYDIRFNSMGEFNEIVKPAIDFVMKRWSRDN